MKTNTNGTHTPKLVYTSKAGMLFQGDSMLLLDKMLSDSVDLVFVDPPFNLGKDYNTKSFDDAIEVEQYRAWCKSWLKQLIRILKPGGALFMYHWPKWLMELGAWLNTQDELDYRSWIALKMKSGFPIRGRLHPAHYGILYYTKRGAKHTFNVVRQQTPICRHCGGEIRDYGGYRKKFDKYEDENGVPWIQMSDFWEDTRPARQDKSRDLQINELPLHVPERVILMASNPGDIVLDIFGGGGSTFHAAESTGRKWIGCELGNVEPIVSRMKSFFEFSENNDVLKALPEHFEVNFYKDALREFRESQFNTRWETVAGLNGSSDRACYHSKTKVLGF